MIIQVASFKLRGKRVFRMSPLHHHFELSGWAEPKVIVRFWILSILFALALALDPEAAMRRTLGPAGRFERVLVYGLGLSGRAAARLLLGARRRGGGGRRQAGGRARPGRPRAAEVEVLAGGRAELPPGSTASSSRPACRSTGRSSRRPGAAACR